MNIPILYFFLFFSSFSQGELQRLKTINMVPGALENDLYWKAEYIPKYQQAAFELKLRDGKFYDPLGKLAQTPTYSLFVLSTEGKFYSLAAASTQSGLLKKGGIYHHSSLLAGADVLMAGRVEFQEGVITYLDNDSGHYKPSREDFYEFLKYMGSIGVDLKRVSYSTFMEERITPDHPEHITNLKPRPAVEPPLGGYFHTCFGIFWNVFH